MSGNDFKWETKGSRVVAWWD